VPWGWCRHGAGAWGQRASAAAVCARRGLAISPSFERVCACGFARGGWHQHGCCLLGPATEGAGVLEAGRCSAVLLLGWGQQVGWAGTAVRSVAETVHAAWFTLCRLYISGNTHAMPRNALSQCGATCRRGAAARLCTTNNAVVLVLPVDAFVVFSLQQGWRVCQRLPQAESCAADCWSGASGHRGVLLTRICACQSCSGEGGGGWGWGVGGTPRHPCGLGAPVGGVQRMLPQGDVTEHGRTCCPPPWALH
jgi:hypothetical protein